MGDRVFEKLSQPQALYKEPILVFAGDALAANGLQGLGREKENGKWRPRRQRDFLQLCRDLSADGYIDGCLMTPADAETLAVDEKYFDAIPVTPMIRWNAETSIWNPRFGNYRTHPAQPFQTVPVEASAPESAYCDAVGNALRCRVRLGLYSITLNNDTERDRQTLLAYLNFAREMGAHPQYEHFLEVFLPNVNLPGMDDERRGQYIADSIVRTMSYLQKKEKPRFIKTQFTTAANWRELCEFDPDLIIGALGGPRINARKTLELAHNVISNGGRAILFGRAIFEDDNPRALCRALRSILNGTQTPAAAFAEYQKSH